VLGDAKAKYRPVLEALRAQAELALGFVGTERAQRVSAMPRRFRQDPTQLAVANASNSGTLRPPASPCIATA